jgi:hypothetical protein
VPYLHINVVGGVCVCVCVCVSVLVCIEQSPARRVAGEEDGARVARTTSYPSIDAADRMGKLTHVNSPIFVCFDSTVNPSGREGVNIIKVCQGE